MSSMGKHYYFYQEQRCFIEACLDYINAFIYKFIYHKRSSVPFDNDYVDPSFRGLNLMINILNLRHRLNTVVAVMMNGVKRDNQIYVYRGCGSSNIDNHRSWLDTKR